MAALGRFSALLLAALCLSGCGTLITRTTMAMPGGDFAGAYPFQAVAVDVDGMFHQKSGLLEECCKIMAFMSIPFDLAIDLVLSPIDLLLWPMGFTKSKGGW